MIDHLDHLVLTTGDEPACVRFYVDVLGMKLETFGEGRKAFRFGNQKALDPGPLHCRTGSSNETVYRPPAKAP